MKRIAMDAAVAAAAATAATAAVNVSWADHGQVVAFRSSGGGGAALGRVAARACVFVSFFFLQFFAVIECTSSVLVQAICHAGKHGI